jgi:hypothetical protein
MSGALGRKRDEGWHGGDEILPSGTLREAAQPIAGALLDRFKDGVAVRAAGFPDNGASR